MAEVHPLAVVAEGARLAEDVRVGPWSLVGADVEVAEGTEIGPHCVLEGDTRVGPRCRLRSHVVLGSAPQDLKYRGEPTSLVVGEGNDFREFVTVNRGTGGGGGRTVIGDGSLFMTGAHVAHDCRVGSGTVFANNATLGGHVDVGDSSTIGAFSAIHQFCRVGPHAFIGGFTVVTKDVLPFVKTVGSRGEVKAYGINAIGLERRGVPADAIAALKATFRRLRKAGSRLDDLLPGLREEAGDSDEVRLLLDFVEEAREGRGFHA